MTSLFIAPIPREPLFEYFYALISQISSFSSSSSWPLYLIHIFTKSSCSRFVWLYYFWNSLSTYLPFFLFHLCANAHTRFLSIAVLLLSANHLSCKMRKISSRGCKLFNYRPKLAWKQRQWRWAPGLSNSLLRDTYAEIFWKILDNDEEFDI